MARRGKGQLGLFRMNAFDAGDHERAGMSIMVSAPATIDSDAETKKAERRIGNMALQQFSSPALPLAKQSDPALPDVDISKTHHQFGTAVGGEPARDVQQRSLNRAWKTKQ